MVLTLGVGHDSYISLSGFPTTFIIDMALLGSTLHVRKTGRPCKERRAQMKLMTRTMLCSLLWRLSATLSALHASSNGRHHYCGKYHDGKAAYYYDESDDGRVYNGLFHFSRTYRDYALGKIIETACGRYADGVKDGTWKYTSRAHGVRRTLTVEYAGGRLTGQYTYKSVCSSGVAGFKTGTNTIRIRTENNHPVNAVECNLAGETLAGGYDAEGRPDGTWTLKPARHKGIKTYHEEWENGVCTSSYVYDNSIGCKHETEHFITELVASIIRRDCTPLERIMTKGSSTLSI